MTPSTMVVDETVDSVEVVATVAKNGSILRTQSLLPEESRALMPSLVDGCEELLHEDKPALVAVGHESDSDESEGDDCVHVLKKSPLSNTVSSSATVSTLDALEVKAAGGPYDCLSDHFTSLFCPVDQSSYLCLQKSSGPGIDEEPRTQMAVASCNVAGCQAYPDLLDSNGGVGLFRAMWPSTVFDVDKAAKTATPHNRASGNRRRRATHFHHLWEAWHPSSNIPLERSKSLPSELRNHSFSLVDESYANDVCYDSDPDQEYPQRLKRSRDMKTCGRNKCNRRPTPVSVIPNSCLETAYAPPAPCGSSSRRFNFCPKEIEANREHRARVGPPRPQGPTEYDLMNPNAEDFLRAYIQEATNTKLSLIWHRPTQGSAGVKQQPPAAVSCAFEVGAHLDNMVLQPKFTWCPSHEPHLRQRRIRMSGTEPKYIELLSVIRVTKPRELDRSVYPFCRLDRACCITTNDMRFPYLVFEAPTPRERDWLVNALKMIVARLASIIIVRDEAKLLEFFTPFAALMDLEDIRNAPCSRKHSDIEMGTRPPLDANGDLQLMSY